MKLKKLAVLYEKRAELETKLRSAERIVERDVQDLLDSAKEYTPDKIKTRFQTRVDKSRKRRDNLVKELEFTQQWIQEVKDGSGEG